MTSSRFAAALGLAALWIAAGNASAKEAAKPVDKAAIARTVKAEVADEIVGINAHDPVQATKWEADDTVSMEAGRPPSAGLKDYREGLGMTFKYAPNWRLRMVDESVDVAGSGDMATYRSTYWQDSTDDAGMPVTQKVNYIAGFAKQTDGAWKIAWSVVAAQERPHKK